ncbi:reverse transcriptase domain-containing protein, partial [Tanacetum coccineum]
PWVTPIHVVLKKGGMAIVLNDNNKLIPSRTVIGWRVFMDDFSVFGNSFNCCLANLDRMLLVFGQRIDEKFKPIYYASKTLNNAQEHYTTTEKELLAVVFSFDKFRPYLILSKTMVYTNHSSLKQKWAENLAADHLSRLENPDLGVLNEKEIANEFPDKHLMILKAKLNDDEPWYADYVNFIVGKDEPYAFRLCPVNVMRRCVARSEILEILAHYHSGPTKGHHSASITERKC